MEEIKAKNTLRNVIPSRIHKNTTPASREAEASPYE